MAEATVNGERVLFFKQSEDVFSDSGTRELDVCYYLFTGNGELRYALTFRFYNKLDGGRKYANDIQEASLLVGGQIFFQTLYNSSTGHWANSYRSASDGSSLEYKGIYSFTFDKDFSTNSAESSEGSGTFQACPKGQSGSVKGDIVNIENGRFHFFRFENHEVIEKWGKDNVSNSSSDGGGNSTGTGNPGETGSNEDEVTKVKCILCHGTGQTQCTYCKGKGYE